MTTTVHKIAVLPGDGIGPEVVDATLMVLDAVQKTGLVHLEYLKGDAGFDSIRKFGTNLPEKTVEMMKRTSACLKGPMTTPEEPGTPRSAAVTMRSLFKQSVLEVAKDYPSVELEDLHIDAAAMQLIRRPESFDVIVTMNLYGDILSDEAAAAVGGLGVAAGANIGEKYGMFEPVHGSAPKYTGQNKVNPVATIEAGRMMLDYLGENKAANLVEKATTFVLKEGKVLTYDLGGKARTSDVGKAIAEKVVSLK